MKSPYTLVNIYAPNVDSPAFFIALTKEIETAYSNLIIIGDFNLTLDVALDRINTYSNNERSADIVKNIMSEYLLEDVWRARNENVQQYT